MEDDDSVKVKNPLIQELWEYKTFAKFYFVLQLLFIILFGALVEYEDTAKGVKVLEGADAAIQNDVHQTQVQNIQYLKFQVDQTLLKLAAYCHSVIALPPI